MKEILINYFLNYEFLYIFLFCFIIFLSISILIKQKLIKKIAILLFSIFFVLFVFEFALSFFMPLPQINFSKDYINTVVPNSIGKLRDIKLLCKDKEYRFFNEDINFDKFENYSLVFDVSYSKYSNYFRVTECNNSSNNTYIFLGCSFIFGTAINDDETLPYYFSKLYNFNENIINCGTSGKSTNTSLNIIRSNLFKFLTHNDSKIEHFFYSLISDHIYRNFRYENLDFLCIDGYLYKDKKWYIPTIVGKIKYIFARSYIFRKVFVPIIDIYFQQYYEDYMIESLKEMNKIVEKKYNSKFTIIVWPESYSKSFVGKLKETKLDLIFLPEYFNSEEDGYRIKHDGHPTAKANKEIAEILYNHISKDNK